eukprot:CAMPEP_0206261794 /NCGR_PEP_ID=MMETSP0047_2-20121206/27857_1 /ASSEMBLY_ACC=CAM_ASM_000192 /TAXON_ID=195065 /ORGANISM="Chroomonas mesostigmatica_cf, Strain CCMP1168" /LENGTH=68 /DNA_ID=CAMNT_0053689057 /DNA_START=48 /DNA_END=251 /DNA_ORIENTATION=-
MNSNQQHLTLRAALSSSPYHSSPKAHATQQQSCQENLSQVSSPWGTIGAAASHPESPYPQHRVPHPSS